MDPQIYHEMFQLEDQHWWFAGRRAILLSILEQHLPRKTRNNILDIGCGTGRWLIELNQYGIARGVDPSPIAVNYCLANGLWSVTRGALPDDLPYPAEHFDLITMLDVLEHVHDDIGALRAVYRLLKPGGLLICTVPAFPWLWSGHDESHQHFRRYVPRDLTDKLNIANFRMVKHTYFNTFLYPPIALIRLLGRAKRSQPHSDATMPPAKVNALLFKIFAAERHLLRHRNFSFGVSELAVVKKEEK